MLMVEKKKKKHLAVGSQPAVLRGENQSIHL
jgi:hypothetical protein